ncbi:hypothetical protein ACFL4L_01580 [bacterium]
MPEDKRPSKDSNGHEHCYYLYFFPWLKLEKTIRVNELTLIPFPSKASEAELEGESNWVSKRLKKILNSYQDSQGKSISEFTFIAGPEGPGISVNDRTMQNLFSAFDLTLNILKFRYLDYHSHERNNHQLLMESAVIYPDNEEIFSLSRNWFHESWTPITKVRAQNFNSEKSLDIDFPLRRIREIFQALQNSHDDLRQRISLAIRFLKLANIESTHIDPQICLELMGAAFEHLFEHPNIIHPDIFAFKLEDLWNYPFRRYEYHPSPFKNKQLKQATQMQTFRLAKQPSSKKSWLQAWFLEFFKFRNDLLFKNPANPKEYAWNLVQHLRVATEIMSMTILIILSRDSQTRLPMKNEDENRIRYVDTYIQYARSIWYSDQYPSEKKPTWVQGEVIPNLWDSLKDEEVD